jgi:DNA-directed RNA polymerase subunit E'/Rpb7
MKRQTKGRKVRKDEKDDERIPIYEPYLTSVLSMKVTLPITEVGGNIKANLEKLIVSKTEGKCIVEGFVRPDSVNILTYSSGKVNAGLVEFMTTYECMVCYPVDGMRVRCICNTITKAGIHAEVREQRGTVPITMFIARDHHMRHDLFEKVVEGAKLIVSVIGVRFELNDSTICAIGKLVDIDQ